MEVSFQIVCAKSNTVGMIETLCAVSPQRCLIFSPKLIKKRETCVCVEQSGDSGKWLLEFTEHNLEGETARELDPGTGDHSPAKRAKPSRTNFKFRTQMLPSLNVNLGKTENVKSIVYSLMEVAEVAPFIRGTVTPKQLEDARSWVWVGCDGEPALKVLRVIEDDAKLSGTCALYPSFGHHLWAMQNAVLGVVQPLVGRFLLSEHAGMNASKAYERFILKNADKHKTHAFLLVRWLTCAWTCTLVHQVHPV